MEVNNPQLGRVLGYAQRGWRMFPCKPRSKEPLVNHWPKRATYDTAQLEKWAGEHPGCNWGLACGPESGLFALDLDGEAGLDWLKAHVDAGNELPETRTAYTPRGLHYYFAWPDALNVRNSVDKLAPHVDVRGAGGYVVIPPSIHPNGTQYESVDDACPVSPAPEWLLELLREVARPC